MSNLIPRNKKQRRLLPAEPSPAMHRTPVSPARGPPRIPAQPAVAQQNCPAAAQQQRPPARSAWGATTGWATAGGTSNSWTANCSDKVAQSKKKGDVIVKPGSTFHKTLHPDLVSIYCGPFFTLGKACGKKDCKNRDGVRKKHMGLHRMSDEHHCM